MNKKTINLVNLSSRFTNISKERVLNIFSINILIWTWSFFNHVYFFDYLQVLSFKDIFKYLFKCNKVKNTHLIVSSFVANKNFHKHLFYTYSTEHLNKQDRFTICFKTCGTNFWVFSKSNKKKPKKVQKAVQKCFQKCLHW